MIGISGSRLLEKLLRGAGCEFNEGLIKVLEDCHEKIYRSVGAETQPFPRARELLETLSEKKIPWAIATTGKLESVKKDLDALGIHPDSSAVITRDTVSDGKPQPDVFIKAAQTLGISMDCCIVVGDSIRDMLAAARGRALAVGMLCGGTSPEALSRAGALCV